MHKLPPIPLLADLQPLTAREICSKLLECCPEGWREQYGEMLDVASLHSHKLTLPMLIAELRRIREHVAGEAARNRAALARHPSIALIRAAFRLEAEHMVRPEMDFREESPMYCYESNGVNYLWLGPGKPQDGGGKWRRQKFHRLRDPTDSFWPPPDEPNPMIVFPE